MAESETIWTLIDTARTSLQELGYTGGLLRQNYVFADVLTNSDERRIPLAAFAQEPTNYRTACFGVVIAEDNRPESINQYRALGAPQILSLGHNQVNRWKVTAQGAAVLQDQFPPDQLANVLREHRSEWNPEAMFRAKVRIPPSSPVQLDFYDAGLLPLIESVVREKLHGLLTQTIGAAQKVWPEHHLGNIDEIGLYRLVFRLLAAKLLADRQHPGQWIYDDPARVIAGVEDFYFSSRKPDPALRDPHVQDTVWRHIRDGFHFQNISIETLAYIYENTLVTPDVRQSLSIHSTPPEVAEYVVERLPFEIIPEDHRRVLEPFAGSSVFLIAALRRLRELLPTGTPTDQRHDYFVQMLAGFEKDPFAIEVAHLSLMLADYPNPNGWRLFQGDVFEDQRLSDELASARVVLCNPPFESFSDTERRTYGNLRSANKAVEILSLVMERPPSLLGLVLPRVFRDGKSYSAIRGKIEESYLEVELVDLPDNAFAHSEAETVLLLAHHRGGRVRKVRDASVTKSDYSTFLQTGRVTLSEDIEWPSAESAATNVFQHDPLRQVWIELKDHPRFDSVGDIHRGIEYEPPFSPRKSELVSEAPQPGYVRGVWQVPRTFEPYVLPDCVFLNMDPSVMRKHVNADKLPWERPKAIANAARMSRGPWTIVATADVSGLVCSQRFHAIWPRKGIPVELLAALINNPVTNAYIRVRRTGRDNQKRLLAAAPVPRLSHDQVLNIVRLVQEYTTLRNSWNGREMPLPISQRCHRTLHEIDAFILSAYGLTSDSEQVLRNFFARVPRPGSGGWGTGAFNVQLTEGQLRTYFSSEGVGLPVVHGQTQRAHDYLKAMSTRRREAQKEAVAQIGPVLTQREVSQLFIVSDETVEAWRSEGRILGVSFAPEPYVFPEWQFYLEGESHGASVAPLVKEILTILGAVHPWVKAQFFLSPSAALGGRTPLEALQEGTEHNIDLVKNLARNRGAMGA